MVFLVYVSTLNDEKSCLFYQKTAKWAFSNYIFFEILEAKNERLTKFLVD